MNESFNDLSEWRKEALMGGGEKRAAAHRSKGKLTVRERLHTLLDEGSLMEIQSFATGDLSEHVGDGVVIGTGLIHGKPVCVYAQDATVYGGSLGEMHAKKIASLMDLAAKNQMPVIGLKDSGGARIQEGVVSLEGYGQIFKRNVLYSGRIPQISVILGSCAGGAVYSPALTDFVFMTEQTAHMFLTGPKVIEKATGETVCPDRLGGASVQHQTSGNVHYTGKDEKDVLKAVRTLLTYIPTKQHAVMHTEARKHDTADPGSILPKDPSRTYDVKQVVTAITDPDSFFETQPCFSKNIVTGFARLQGASIGIVANQPKVLAGSLNLDAADKAARFIRFCDAFHIPILTLVDVPGFLPGEKAEHAGIIRHGAKLLYAYAEATVPKITVILRKAFGGAYVAMNSKGLGADFVYAWPEAEIDVMGKTFADEIVHPASRESMNKPSVWKAAQAGLIDDIFMPSETRERLIRSFDVLRSKEEDRPLKKHGNMPL
ncbi:acyl-CoA carboxylase subunit beta [Bacillus safensis]|uniref:acyl-CoA carboxylase subunit beta n=1 Tax=Bacillus safensis TaxID=561879 RepID=UPI0022828A83|nr:acyl-CoA carboxylase subunit beta [Bacillus safensis]MCY7674619.1 acyl-CoA carboxylase subunit beta [Bacillus safensis]MCY7698152.1 acyl-CoA carboxylase subunit beta [Bacillus safensis]MEC3628532.1 acyl-CoA carboxylase subunit beta [Bacillus safensis]